MIWTLSTVFLIGFVLSFLGEKFKPGTGAFATAATLLGFFIVFSTQLNGIYTSIEWIPILNIELGVLLDGISISVSLLILGVSFVVSIYSRKYMEGRKHLEFFYPLLLSFVISMIGVIVSTNFIQFYLFWELMVLPAYIMIVMWGTHKTIQTGLKFFIFMNIGAGLVLLGLIGLFHYTNSFDMYEIALNFSDIPTNVANISLLLMTLGFLIKMAVFPFHSWLPDTLSRSPTPVSAIISALMDSIGAYGLVRISILYPIPVWLVNGLSVLAGLSIAYGGFLALTQSNIKRLLAYSSISQMGYILLGIVSGQAGLFGATFHILNHGVTKSLLFLSAGSIIHTAGGKRNMNKVGGLFRVMPITAGLFILGAIALTGAPPFNLFSSEWIIFTSGISSGRWIPTLIGILTTVITAGYMLLAINAIFFGKLPQSLKKAKDPHPLIIYPLVILAVMIILAGIWPVPLLGLIQEVCVKWCT